MQTNNILKKTGIPTGCFIMVLIIFLATYAYVASLTQGAVNPAPWDADWYRKIAFHGYSFNPETSGQQNIVFFPLYPMALNLIYHIFRPDMISCFIITSSLFTLCSSFFLYKITTRIYNRQRARIALLLFLSNPFAIYLFNGYSEAAWIFAILGTIYSLENRKNYPAALIFINLAAMARPYGILLGLVLFYYLLQELYHKRQTGEDLNFAVRELNYLLFWLPLAFLSLQLFTGYLWIKFDDPLVFWHGLQAWTSTTPTLNPGFPGEGLYRALRESLQLMTQGLSGLATPKLWAALYFLFCLFMVTYKVVGHTLKRDKLQTLDMLGIAFFSYFFYVAANNPNLANLGRHLLPVYLASGVFSAGFFCRKPKSGARRGQLLKLCFGLFLLLQSTLFMTFTYRFYSSLWVS